MRCAVETVTANASLLIQLIRQAIQIGVRWKGMMKRGVKNSDMRNCGEQPPHVANSGDNDRIMQWGEGIDFFHLGQKLVGDERRFGEFFAAVNNPMSNDAYFGSVADDAGLFGR